MRTRDRFGIFRAIGENASDNAEVRAAAREAKTERAKHGAMTTDQYDAVLGMKAVGASSARVAIELEMPPHEVNAAFASPDYQDYLVERMRAVNYHDTGSRP